MTMKLCPHVRGFAGCGIAALLVMAGSLPSVAAAPAQIKAGVSCVAVGSYAIGSVQPRPLSPSPTTGIANSMRSNIVQPVYVPMYLRGRLALSAYTSCGSATAGSFTVALAPIRTFHPLPSASSKTVPGRSAASTGLTSTTVLSATGMIAQDAGHANDSLYVTVSGSVTYGRVTLGCGVACASGTGGAQYPCKAGSECGNSLRLQVTRVATFTGITGYLLLNAKRPSTVMLTFLPPPAANSDTAVQLPAPQPVTLQGTRVSS